MLNRGAESKSQGNTPPQLFAAIIQQARPIILADDNLVSRFSIIRQREDVRFSNKAYT
jgi:hypothetical protein